jgi:glycerophosphoryl diester phosphodiesterase
MGSWTILILDQKDVPMPARVRKIEEHKAEAYAMLIIYSFKDAQACYALNTNIMMEVMIPDRGKLAEFEKTGVPWRNIVAFVGHTPPQDRTLFGLIHAKGASCIVGTSRNLDRQFLNKQVEGIEALEPDYRALLRQGTDLIETDIPVPLGRLLYGDSSLPSSKKTFFRHE